MTLLNTGDGHLYVTEGLSENTIVLVLTYIVTLCHCFISVWTYIVTLCHCVSVVSAYINLLVDSLRMLSSISFGGSKSKDKSARNCFHQILVTLRRMDCTGFEDLPVTLSVSKVDKDGHRETLETNSVCLKPQGGLPEDLPCLVQREDGWMEIEMGTYHVSIDEGGGNGKTGLFVEGIELRPLD
ncbi:hypothetical protein Cgig2_004167 [Carnegiea gigantea]|uniref:Uncharacterized protein n=1 Tax=Carnegiea gigantea TaxID=171969 RepID=A0A9Q1KU38_9CARY|nr:hypothetical protein Cgig2_004165 [Carnegiea gigantea]KAJ8449112.1 hypothetical protein Cgig2_004167 [Carnegiea gigantea]